MSEKDIKMEPTKDIESTAAYYALELTKESMKSGPAASAQVILKTYEDFFKRLVIIFGGTEHKL